MFYFDPIIGSIENKIRLTDTKLRKETYLGTKLNIMFLDIAFTTITDIGFVLPEEGIAIMGFVDISRNELKETKS